MYVIQATLILLIFKHKQKKTRCIYKKNVLFFINHDFIFKKKLLLQR